MKTMNDSETESKKHSNNEVVDIISDDFVYNDELEYDTSDLRSLIYDESYQDTLPKRNVHFTLFNKSKAPTYIYTKLRTEKLFFEA